MLLIFANSSGGEAEAVCILDCEEANWFQLTIRKLYLLQCNQPLNNKSTILV
ncbi:hypothetical protein SOVF_042710 [Spinacia oleracea]|nr:hypothetical protein SOVF_042710 [Spinacia oleracea]